MTIQRSYGPIISIGQNPAIGTTTPTSATPGPPPYVSGVGENPDAAPSVFFGGTMYRDSRIYSRPDGATLVAGGYANQDFSVDELTVDILPSTAAAANIAALHALTLNTPIPLVTTSGAGITVLTAPFTVPGTLNVIPTGSVRIDANPAYTAYGTSGAVQGWSAVAAGRAVSLTSTSNLSAVNVTVNGYDVYGFPYTQTLAGPNINTVNTLKGFKWIKSVVPSATNAGTMSVGTADIFQFPLRADKFCDVLIWVGAGPTLITANTGFVAAVTTSPNTAALGDVRGTYALQTPSNGTTVVFQVRQIVRPTNRGSAVGMFGVAPV